MTIKSRQYLVKQLNAAIKESKAQAPYFDDRLLRTIETLQDTIRLIDLENDPMFDGDILDHV